MSVSVIVILSKHLQSCDLFAFFILIRRLIFYSVSEFE